MKRRIGYLPENPPLYPEMEVAGFLEFVARLRGVPRSRIPAAVDRAVGRCALGDARDRIIGKLSRGYRQRVGLAQALVHDPELLVLDEPTAGLDPKQIQETRLLIRELAGDRTVVLSTHILPEVETTCDRLSSSREAGFAPRTPRGASPPGGAPRGAGGASSRSRPRVPGAGAGGAGGRRRGHRSRSRARNTRRDARPAGRGPRGTPSSGPSWRAR